MYLCTETRHGQKAENSPLKAYHGLQGREKLETKTWLSKTRQNETRKQLVGKNTDIGEKEQHRQIQCARKGNNNVEREDNSRTLKLTTERIY